MHKTLEPKNSVQAPNIQNVQKKIFGEQYKERLDANFSKIKKYIIDNEPYIPNYNEKIASPIEICDIIIAKSPITFTELNKLPDNTKKCISDILLGLFTLDKLKSQLGEMGLFWLRHNAYTYSDFYTNTLRNYLIENTNFVGSIKRYNDLSRSHYSPLQINGMMGYDENTTLTLFAILSNIDQDLNDVTALGPEFSLGSIRPRHNNVKGYAESWGRMDLDKEGNKINDDIFYALTTGDKNGREISNKRNLNIYNNREGTVYKIYLDSPLAIGLYYNKKPIAVLGFSTTTGTTLRINQMQTIAPSHYDRYGRMTKTKADTIVQTYPWQEILYKTIIQIAEKYNIKTIEIPSGHKNKRTTEEQQTIDYDNSYKKRVKVTTDKPHLPLNIALKIYDKFAEKNNFTQDPKSKIWVKNI